MASRGNAAKNAKALILGFNKFRSMRDSLSEKLLRSYARKAVIELVEAYDAKQANMTGNAINSFAYGFYLKGRLQYVETARKISGIPPATGQNAYPGESVREYDTGKNTVVREYRKKSGYRFQSVGNFDGASEAVAFLQGQTLSSSHSTGVIVCWAAPYADYLERKRKMHVLEKEMNTARLPISTV